jgi:hypothetical protein
MDEHEKAEEQQVEDLEPPAEDAEDVKGGGGITAEDDWESPVALKQADGSVRQGVKRGGWDGNHNETFVRI